ncbi:hypothetical protein KSC_030140 [Ktedonobacter sp. SOSP1-52]|nr:hypothetical protein KSC_030140 [Ktedonobacter sp. SOSP1-52]
MSARFDDQSRREADAETLESVTSTPASGVATLEEEAYRLQLEERRIEGLRNELHLQQQSLAYTQVIAYEVFQWTYPDLDEKLVLAMVVLQKILSGENGASNYSTRIIILEKGRTFCIFY